MTENTEMITKAGTLGQSIITENGESSKALNVSVRGWLSILLTFTVCLMSGVGMTVNEPLYSGWLLALGFYFGQKVGKS